MTDEELIKKTLKLAEKGRGQVSPNPMVGAIFVVNNKIIGQGYHKVFGGEHAEVAAYRAANQAVAGGTLYVNLEPCSHHGKQPPCVDLIVQSGIQRVVIGTQDPNPVVNGAGIKQLQNHGIAVKVGILEDACKGLNEAYFKHIVSGLPLTTLKIAQTLDGRIAARNGQSQWITSEESRHYVHKLRSYNDAVVIGIGTVLADDPSLTVRLTQGRNPRRIIVDSKLRIPLQSKLLNDRMVEKIATTSKASQEKIKSIEGKGAVVWVNEANSVGQVDLPTLWHRIGRAGFSSVLVEGGSRISSALLKVNLVDKMVLFIAPKILGAGMPAIQNLGISSLDNSVNLLDFHKRQIGNDILITGRIKAN
ncbi:MAG: bifunctional diaminohydroxyphosphoribosylaminopyrimidine deaminase/5-amino-6-(5-phosphoribosylamino)uracil reductase RibD [bacterium]